MKKIGLLGLTLDSGNKGCEALTYSFLEIINKVYAERNEHIKVIMFLPYYLKTVIKNRVINAVNMSDFFNNTHYSNLNVKKAFYRIDREGRIKIDKCLLDCNCVFDFTAGDSFTDIYGNERFITRTSLKKHVIDLNIPFILGSQTIGPFKADNSRKMARNVIMQSKEVFVRDKMSYDCVLELSGRKSTETIDIAFELPYSVTKKIEDGKKHIGLNVSGLLWNGGYTRNNQFDLTVDYKKFISDLVSVLSKDKNSDIYLILHAFNNDLSYVDNDYAAAMQIKKCFPNVIVSPLFKTPMEAKTYIAKMDVLLGARMHATIGALSANVPTIAFSYSRKFEGLYESLDYPFVIHGSTVSTEEALETALEWISDIPRIKAKMEETKRIIIVERNRLYEAYKKILP